MTAVTKVLQSFELLEAILLQSETYEICTATAVCTSWRAVVENSKALRTYILTIPLRGPGPSRTSFNPPNRRINSSANAIWHFGVKTADKGSLFIMRFPAEDVEIFFWHQGGRIAISRCSMMRMTCMPSQRTSYRTWNSGLSMERRCVGPSARARGLIT